MFKNKDSMFSNNSSKYGNLLTVILIVSIVAIVGIIIFIGVRIYNKYNVEKGAAAAVSQFENIVSSDNNANDPNNTNGVGNITGIADIDETGDSSEIKKSSDGKTYYKGYEVVATIQIPTIKLKYPILEKVTKKSLETAVAWLYGPGLNKVGNNVIIGHNYRNGTMFSNVKNLKNGDKIYITDESGQKVKYSVYKIYRTTGDDASYMTRDTKGKREISLSTCTDDSKARTIVWAVEE